MLNYPTVFPVLMAAVKRSLNLKVMDWLLGAEQPSVRYFTLTELLERRADDPDVVQSRKAIEKRGWAHDILSRQKRGGYWESPKSLYQPKYTSSNWMALVLSDLGLTRESRRIEKAAELFFREWLPDEWMEKMEDGEVCVIGNTARMLSRFGYSEDPKVKKLFQWLVDDQKEDGGWHCFESDTGTLDCWEALAAFSALPRRMRSGRVRRSVERGAEFYLERKLFEEGTGRYAPWFRFHYPNHYYYDILVGLDVITSLGFADDRRLRPALEYLEGNRRRDGTWSIARAHPDIGRGAGYRLRNKPVPFALETAGSPSKWITLKSMLVLKRAGRLDL